MTPSAAQLEDRIAALEELRSSGLASSSRDGSSDAYRSQDDLDAEIRRLRNQLAELRGATPRHPYARQAF